MKIIMNCELREQQTGTAFCATLFLVLLLFAGPASADDLKKNVFRDCHAVAEGLSGLQPEQKVDFISYLQRVLNMQSGGKDELITDSASIPQGPTSNPLTDQLQPITLWRIFEPTRELEAKRCAVDLLKKLAPDSLALVPEMIRLSEEPKTSSALVRPLEEGAWTITLAAAQDPNIPLTDEFIEEIEQSYFEHKSYLAENFLIELHQRVLPWLIREFRNPNEKRRAKVRKLLLEIDDQGLTVGPFLVPLLQASDDDLRSQVVLLLKALPGFYRDSLPLLLRRLDDPSAAVKSQVYAALREIFACPHRIQIARLGDDLLLILLREFNNEEGERRNIAGTGIALFGSDSAMVNEHLIKYATSENDALRGKAIKLLGEMRVDSPTVRDVLLQALYDPSITVRISALEAFQMRPSLGAGIGQALAKFLKSVARQLESYPKERLILEAATTVASLPQDPSIQRLIPYFVDALGYRAPPAYDGVVSKKDEIENPAAKALVKIGQPVVPLVVKAMRKNDSLVRKRSIWILGELRPVMKSTLSSLSYALKDSDTGVRTAAVRALAASGPASMPYAERAFSWPEPQARLAAAHLLYQLGRRDGEIAQVFTEDFKQKSCVAKRRLYRNLLELPVTDRTEIEEQLLRCLQKEGANKEEILILLSERVPLTAEALQLVATLLSDKELDNETRINLAKKARQLGLDEQQLTGILRGILEAGDNSVKNRVVPIFGELGSAAKEAVPQLRAIAGDSEREIMLRYRAVVALTAIDVQQSGYEEFFSKELSGERGEAAQAAVREISPDLAVPLLVKSLRSLPRDRKPIAVEALASFGRLAQEASQDLVSLASEEDAFLRFESTVALLQIEPGRPELPSALREQLVGKYRRKLAQLKLPEDARPILEQIEQQRSSFLEQRGAQKLLENLRGEVGSCANQ